jgi:hypothetical protein
MRRIEVQSQPGQIVLRDLISKKPFTKRAGGVAQGVGPEFKPQYWKKKKERDPGTAKKKKTKYSERIK